MTEPPPLVLGRAHRRTALVWLPESLSTVFASAILALAFLPLAALFDAWFGAALWARGQAGILQTGLCYVLAYLLGVATSLWLLSHRAMRRSGARFAAGRVALFGRGPEDLRSRRHEMALGSIGRVLLALPDEIVVGFAWPTRSGDHSVRIPIGALLVEDRFEDLLGYLREALPDGLYSVFDQAEHSYSRPFALGEVFSNTRMVQRVMARHRGGASRVVDLVVDGLPWQYEAREGLVSGPDDSNTRLMVRHSCAFAPNGLVVAEADIEAPLRTEVWLGSGEHLCVDLRRGTVHGHPNGRNGDRGIGARIGSVRLEGGATVLQFDGPVPDVLAVLAILYAGHRHLHLAVRVEIPSPDADASRDGASCAVLAGA